MDLLPSGSVGPWLRYVADEHLAELRLGLIELTGSLSVDEIVEYIHLSEQPARHARAAGYDQLGTHRLMIIEALASESDAMGIKPDRLIEILLSDACM